MKLLFLSDLWEPFPGGAERYICNVAREMTARGHDVCALTSYERATHTPTCIVDERLGQHLHRPFLERESLLIEYLKTLEPDVVFVHRFFAEHYADVLHAHCARLIEIVHQHRYTRADLVIFNSEYTKSQNFSRPTDIVVLPPAYKADVWTPTHDTAIGFVKPLEGKGVDLVYQIADRLPHRRFVILRGEWQAIETIQSKPNVFFLQPVPSMKDFYSRCSCVLVPSLREDAGTIPQEAAYAEVPCIASRIMGLAETNTGGIFPSHRYVECWGEEIEQLFRNPYHYAAVVRRQKEFVDSYDWPTRFDQLNQRLGA